MTRNSKFNLLGLFVVMSMLAATVSVVYAAKATTYQTGFIRWRGAANDFASWQFNGTSLAAGGSLQLDQATASAGTDPYEPGAYNGHNFYNGGSFFVGEAIGPVVTTPFAFSEAIASWNASTPTGTWIEVQIRVQFGTRWSKWYNLGVWASDTSTIERHSVNLQGDADGYVAVDTWITANKKEATTALQLKLRLFSADGSAIPTIRNASVAYSMSAPKSASLEAGNPAHWNRLMNVPECSQMVYADGGEVWCSPTSTSMVLKYWANDTGPCEPVVRASVAGVYDWLYNGHGNWPFNTAYAATQNLDGYVVRFSTLKQVEDWVAAGVPVVVSFAWKKSELTGAAIPSSNGHLAAIVGFDAQGNPIVNDPAAATDSEVQRTYDRSEFETVWLKYSAGTVYLIYPASATVPNLP
jgi:hypothetical protein